MLREKGVQKNKFIFSLIVCCCALISLIIMSALIIKEKMKSKGEKQF